MRRHTALAVSLAAFAFVALSLIHPWTLSPKAASSGYHVLKKISVSGDEGWDYVGVDSVARRIYISHGSRVVVLDADSGTVAGEIPDTQGVPASDAASPATAAQIP
jgi:hypothetical protein